MNHPHVPNTFRIRSQEFNAPEVAKELVRGDALLEGSFEQCWAALVRTEIAWNAFFKKKQHPPFLQAGDSILQLRMDVDGFFNDLQISLKVLL